MINATHRSELNGSRIASERIEARGYRTVELDERDELRELGVPSWAIRSDDAFPGLLIPLYRATGEQISYQFKPAVPQAPPGKDKPMKYASLKGMPACIDVPPGLSEGLRDISRPLWITEGVKKADCLASRDLIAAALTGVWNWRRNDGSLGDWEDIPLKGRRVIICFDSDANEKRQVMLAMRRFGEWLKSKGCSQVYYLIVPGEVNGSLVKGVDDYFAAGGELQDLSDAAVTSLPVDGAKDAAFSDAYLTDTVCEERLAGKYLWCQGLGWMHYRGSRWGESSDVEVMEEIRQWAIDQWQAVLLEARKDPNRDLKSAQEGWRSVLSSGRLRSLASLARGPLITDAARFDANPDLLNCPNGVVDLRTGELTPPSPDHLMTKVTGAEYIPGWTDPDFRQALQALPADLHDWYQLRIGQAFTGYMTPDDVLLVQQGGGENGKSTLNVPLRTAAGSYYVMVSHRVLTGSSDQHPTELMDFRGARYAMMEETPEARRLDPQHLRTTVGTPEITARKIRQDSVTFAATHSMFVNTNFTPQVTESDHGTWRRLALVKFPYTFRKSPSQLVGPLDRLGDPELRERCKSPSAARAALAWAVQGAMKWYADKGLFSARPERVEADTRAWREEGDKILAFASEQLLFGPTEQTPCAEMHRAFNEWLVPQGHKEWSAVLFGQRFASHSEVQSNRVDRHVVKINGKAVKVWRQVGLRGERDPFGNTGMEPSEGPETPPVTAVTDGSVNRDIATHVAVNGSVGNLGNPQVSEPRISDPAPDDCACGYPEDSCCCVELAPVAVGFDLETADADKLFVGGHEGPFVRLCGMTSEETGDALPIPHTLIQDLNAADVIYGHNILGFDLLALAYHHGADYDALAAKAVDTLPLERLNDPPLSKGMPNGYYGLDATARRLGHVGKTDDIKGLARKHGGYDKIPVDDPEYAAYLRGDLAATKYVYESQLEMDDYARREMKVAALQNRMTLNGWAVDRAELDKRVAKEAAQRAAAIGILASKYGVPTHRPDRFKLLRKDQWPEPLAGTLSAAEGRKLMKERPDKAVSYGIAERIPGNRYDSPWATDAGREAIIKAFAAAGAVTPQGRPAYPTTAQGVLALGKDAMGDGEWYCPVRRKSIPGMLSAKAFGHLPAVRELVETILLATGARMKYAEVEKWTTAHSRVHAWIGDAQGSGRWAMTKPSTTNMGARGEASEERAVLVADNKDEVLVTCDLSQVDMRAVAGLSQDPAYMALFEPGRDAHSEMAVVYFGSAEGDNRHKTKAINHKFNYGGGVKSTAAMNGLPVELVQQAYDARAQAYPRLIEWTDEVRDIAASGELLDNGFGRKMRPNPERAATQGPALMGQGAARDIMCESLLRLVEMADAEGRNVRPLLRGVVHDEVIMSVPRADVADWQRLLKAAFTWEWKGVPILCDLGTPAYRWSDCK